MSDAAPTQWFVWLSDEYSVPRETLCYRDAPSPNADFRCIRAAGHAGRCSYSQRTALRPHSHKVERP